LFTLEALVFGDEQGRASRFTTFEYQEPTSPRMRIRNVYVILRAWSNFESGSNTDGRKTIIHKSGTANVAKVHAGIDVVFVLLKGRSVKDDGIVTMMR
jgi:hypothetical protein